jgi:Glutathione S-transferase, N-terminal domain
VPVLWDKKTGTIVNNESSEIIRMFSSAFDDITDERTDYYPAALRSEIDAVNERIYEALNNGVYRCGLATKQEVYELTVTELFETCQGVTRQACNLSCPAIGHDGGRRQRDAVIAVVYSSSPTSSGLCDGPATSNTARYFTPSGRSIKAKGIEPTSRCGIPAQSEGRCSLKEATAPRRRTLSCYWATTPHAMRPPAFPAGSLV